jgi:DNA mismatch repair protein MutS2
MEQRILEKLEWPSLTELLAAWTQTEEGRTLCLDLRPVRKREDILTRWVDVTSVQDVVKTGARPPIGALTPMAPIFKAASVGHVLTGVDLRCVYDLLAAVKRVHAFAADMSAKSATLRRMRGQLYPLPALMQTIERTCAPNGSLLDTASEELQRLRRQKLGLTRRIEEQIKRLLREAEIEQYLQDDFYTLRNDRWVIPMRLDGRGRIKGSIIDTSESGQTLFIEPAAINPLNEELLEIDLAEKLEILRIFRDLTTQVATEVESLRGNYETLIYLDCLSAEASLAVQLQAGTVELVDQPILDLRSARHPLILKAPALESGEPDPNPTRARNAAVGSHIALDAGQSCLIVSGPNAGGKTVVLKTVGILHLMARAGLLIPADSKSRMFLFDKLWLEMGDSQSLAASLSTFSGHMMGLRPILDRAGARDLAMLDELAVGTEPQTGAAIGQAVLESLATRGTHCVATTHFDNLKSLPVSDKRFRNGSMEYSLSGMRPTYQLILDVPGQSHGIELARQMGLPPSIIDRATALRGGSLSALDEAVTQLMAAREEMRNQEKLVQTARLEAETAKARWESEREALEESRRKASRQVAEKWESELSTMRAEIDDAMRQMRDTWKQVQKLGADATESDRQSFIEQKNKAGKVIRDIEGKLQNARGSDAALPGFPCSFRDLSTGIDVWVIPVKKQGKVVKTGDSESDPIEVLVGAFKLRVPLHDLRLMQSPATPAPTAPAPRNQAHHQPRKATPQNFVLQTPTNSVDLRGMDADQGLENAMRFIDKAVLRGEEAVILIHGHGTDKLKNTLRRALEKDSPYDIQFRPGEASEGGDGVTIVYLQS